MRTRSSPSSRPCSRELGGGTASHSRLPPTAGPCSPHLRSSGQPQGPWAVKVRFEVGARPARGPLEGCMPPARFCPCPSPPCLAQHCLPAGTSPAPPSCVGFRRPWPSSPLCGHPRHQDVLWGVALFPLGVCLPWCPPPRGGLRPERKWAWWPWVTGAELAARGPLAKVQRTLL